MINFMGLISKKDESAYREEVQRLMDWCKANNLSHVDKTKKIVINFRRTQNKQFPLNIDGLSVYHVFSIQILYSLSCILGHGGLEPSAGDLGHKTGYTVDRVPIHLRTHTTDNLNCKRKSEYPEKTHQTENMETLYTQTQTHTKTQGGNRTLHPGCTRP